MNRKKYGELFENTYANKKSSMSKKQAAIIIKNAPPAIVPSPTSTPTPVNEVKPCRACDEPIFIKPTIIKKKIAEDQV
jgi:hypothetical protein